MTTGFLVGGFPPAAVPYNNLAIWPSIGLNDDAPNRPIFNTDTGILSWIGPIGGGPSTSTDFAQTLALTNSGNISSSSNGQVISGLNIDTSGDASSTSAIFVQHNNVTIKMCRLKVGGYPGLSVSINPGVTGLIVEDCELDGNNDSSQNYAVSNFDVGGLTSQLTIRRCNIHGFEKFLGSQYQTNNLHVDNYLSTPSGNDCDGSPVWFTSNSVTLQHNTIDASGTGWDSFLQCTNYDGGTDGGPGPITNISVINNCLLGGLSPHWIVFADNYHGNSGVLSGLTVTNNGFYNVGAGGGNYSDLQNTSGTPGFITANSGNFDMATPLATAGTPTNGTGSI